MILHKRHRSLSVIPMIRGCVTIVICLMVSHQVVSATSQFIGDGLGHTLVPAFFLKGSTLESMPYRSYYPVPVTVSDQGELYREVFRHGQIMLQKFNLFTQQKTSEFPLSGALSREIIMVDDTLYVFTIDGKVTKVTTEELQVVWQSALSSYVVQAVHNGGALYLVTAHGDVLKMDGTSGDIKWISSLTNGVDLLHYQPHSLAISDDVLYVGAKRSVEAYSLDQGDWLGAFNVSLAMSQELGGVVGPLTVQQGQMVFARFDGTVHAFPLGDFQSSPRWLKKFAAQFTTKVDGVDNIFIGTLDGKVLTLDKLTGDKKSYIKISDAPISSIVPLDLGESHLTGHILVTTTRGEIFGLTDFAKTLVFKRYLPSSLYATPIVRRISYNKYPMIFAMTGHKNVYGFHILDSF
ncbi:MAG: PQQ-binding-like beta-propeller repeat protein [Proteobacteria bacterium]|nr:PQQ-binding-like beta-propeller repeat protein [Pseudomonadota bacterium]